jgi:hypothetical protein
MEETMTTPEEDPTTPIAAKGLSEDQRSEICRAVGMGEMRASTAATAYGVSNQAISDLLKRRAISYGCVKREIEDKARAIAISKAAESFAEKRMIRAEEANEFYYTRQFFMAKKMMMSINENLKAGRVSSFISADIKADRMAMIALQTSRQEVFAMLKIDEVIDENELPVITIRDLTQDEITQLAKNDEVDGDLLDLPLASALEDLVIEGDS